MYNTLLENRKPVSVLNPMHWDADETRGWLVLQFTGHVALYGSRCFLVVAIVPMAEELGWDERQCGLVLSAFFWGYVLTQIIGGNLSDRFGGDLVQFAAAVVWSLATLSAVYLARVSIWPLVCARFITGLAQGMHYPALVSLIAHKVPEHSQTKFYGVSTAGSYIGAMLIGFIGSEVMDWFNWKALVILITCFSFAWTLSLKLFSSSHHKKLHYRLSDGLKSTGQDSSRLKLHVQPSSVVTSCHKVPWKELFTQSSVIAYLCAFVAESSYIHIIPSWTPTFFSELYPSRSSSAWLYNGAPSLIMATGAYSSSIMINNLIAQKFDVTLIRKVGCCICLLGPAVFLTLISMLGRGDSSYPVTLSLLLFSSYFVGYTTPVVSANVLDLTPTYSGSLYGVANTLGALPGVFAVPLIGYILHSTGSWALVFLLQVAVLTAGCLVFLAYGSAQRLKLT